MMETSGSFFPSFSIGRSIETSSAIAPHFAMTTAGFIVPTITGILSTCCYVLILYAIYKSPHKLSTTYHRIMAMMSIFDILASVCIAFTTLPMPSDDIVRFAGPMLGNHLTCQIQGCILSFGLAGGGSLYMCLSWYFVCRMTLMMHSNTITKRIEPLFYLISFGIAIFLPSYYLSKDLLNTVPSDQFCGIGINHSNCNYTFEKEFYECDHQINDTTYPEFEMSLDIVMYLIGFNVVMIVIAMVIIIWTILKKNKSIRCALEEQRTFASSNTPSEDEINISELRYARVLVVQALMYIFAYLITWIFMIIPMAVYLDRETLNIVQVFKAIFFPMQGFWNLIIFIYDKAYLLYQDDEDRGCWEILKTVLFRPYTVSDIILPDSLVNADKNSNASIGEILETSNIRNNERMQDVGYLASSQSCKNSDIEYSENNMRFYVHSNGIRRAGRMEDQLALDNAPASIESPCGFASGSRGSTVS